MKKNIRFIISVLIVIFCFALTYAQMTNPAKEGYVPNEKTAIAIAETLWLPVYGEKINNSKPFTAELRNGKVWVVQGTLQSQKGGVPYIEIQRSDCKILKMYHGK